MKVFQATIDDIEGVAQLFNEYRLFYGQPLDIEGSKNYIRRRIENEESVIFIVEDQQEYLGFTQMYPTFSSISMKKDWILNDLFVREDARKQGVGQLLLNAAKQYAIQTDAKGINLCTTVDNMTAQKLYEKNGYVRDLQYYHYYLNTQ